MIIQSIQEQSIGKVDLAPFSNKIEVTADIAGDSILWFYPYLASGYPEIDCDKRYLFLYGTDHDQGLTGGLYLGKGDSLSLSDFREVGLIRNGNQAETPLLKRFPNEARPIYIYYHTIEANPLNTCGGQETNLMTTTGGTLVGSTFTDESNPLGCQGTVDGIAQNHTGYLNYWDIDGSLIGCHLFNGGNPSYYQKSTTFDGKTFFHNSPFSKNDVSFGDNRFYVFNRMTPFKRNGQWYAFINSADLTNGFSAGATASGQLHLVKMNRSLDITEKLFDLTDNEQQSMTVYVEGNTAHIYRQTGRPDEPQSFTDFLSYSFLDLTFLDYL